MDVLKKGDHSSFPFLRKEEQKEKFFWNSKRRKYYTYDAKLCVSGRKMERKTLHKSSHNIPLFLSRRDIRSPQHRKGKKEKPRRNQGTNGSDAFCLSEIMHTLRCVLLIRKKGYIYSPPFPPFAPLLSASSKCKIVK
jgi:hypothetical protein